MWPAILVLRHLRIDEELDRHIDRPAQARCSAPVKQKHASLLKIRARLVRRDIEARRADERPVGYVRCPVIGDMSFTEVDRRSWPRPVQPSNPSAGAYRSIEPHDDGAIEHEGGCLFGALGGAAKAGDLAKHAIERHRGEGHQQHEQCARGRERADAAMTALERGAARLVRSASDLRTSRPCSDGPVEDVAAHAHDRRGIEQRDQRDKHQRDGDRAHAALTLPLRARLFAIVAVHDVLQRISHPLRCAPSARRVERETAQHR